MTLSFRLQELRLRHPFTLARGSSATRTTVAVTLSCAGLTGYGEAAPIPRYGEDPGGAAAFLAGLDLAPFDDPLRPGDVLDLPAMAGPRNAAARAAVDIALHDLEGKARGLPLWKLWGLDPARAPRTSMTIGIDAPGVVEEKVREARAFPVLKVKLGGGDDRAVIAAVRRATAMPLRIDANEGWKTKEEALERILWLQEENVEFVEQPMPDSRNADMPWVRSRVRIPLIADESVHTSADIPLVAEGFDGVNIKLMKSGGIREGRRMIDAARAAGLRVMLGCMIESSVGIAAAFHLSPLADYADLDGNLLIAGDPFGGIDGPDRKLPLAPGLGVAPRPRPGPGAEAREEGAR